MDILILLEKNNLAKKLRDNLRKRKVQKTSRLQQNQANKTENENMQDVLKIVGGNKLSGTVNISGAKNSALPIIFASILASEPVILNNVPNLSDMDTSFAILEALGVTLSRSNNQAHIDSRNINKFEFSYDLGSQMRASILALGPLLAKYKSARIPLPGGCNIGARPINMHLDFLEKMGVVITSEHGYLLATAPISGLNAIEYTFDKISVGATEHIIMCAAMARGDSVIINVAREPEVVDLCNFLNALGAKISGIGTSLLRITGVPVLGGTEYSVIPDRIEAGSYAIAALATKGEVILNNFNYNLFGDFAEYLQKTGAIVKNIDNNSVLVQYSGETKAVDITTSPYPAFPTDLQSQWMSLMSVAEGKSIIVENIFENRFAHVAELVRMGANITIQDKHTAIINAYSSDNKSNLTSAEVKATDLRAAFSLIIAALVANGESTIHKLHHLDRGYNDVVSNLRNLGANIKRETQA